MTTKRYVATEAILKEEMLEFERRFDMDSFEIRRLHRAGEAPDHIDPHDRMIWIDTLERWEWVRERERAASPR